MMMRAHCLAVILTLGFFGNAGLADAQAPSVSRVPATGLVRVEGGQVQIINSGAQQLIERMPSIVAQNRPILVTTMVALDNLGETSTFGRVASQILLNKLSRDGYAVRDMTYVGVLTLDPVTGETVLSRNNDSILWNVDAQAVVAGTYAVGGREIYLSIRLLRAQDGLVLSSADVVIPLDHNNEIMLAPALLGAVAAR